MKKLLTLILLVGITQSAHAWFYTFENQTNEQLQFSTTYFGGGICSNKNTLVDAQQSRNIDSGICCLREISAQSKTMSGSATLKPESLMTCRHAVVRAFRDAAGRLQLEEIR